MSLDIDALKERLIAKKPDNMKPAKGFVNSITNSRLAGFCPNCKEYINNKTSKLYCEHCTQKLDWTK